jgi:hypothetical protein
MKIPKSLLAGLLLAGFASAASAQTHIYIAGSTAFRGGATKAIEDTLTPGYSYAFDAGSTGSKTQYSGGAAIYSGTIATGLTDAGSPVIIKTFWTGSAAGCLDVSSTTSVTGFIPDNRLPQTSGSNGLNVNGYTKESDVPNVAFSDAFSASVAASIATAPGNGKTFSARVTAANLQAAGSLGETVVGIVPFVWVAGAQSTGTVPFSNITQQAASALCSAGRIPAMALQSGTAAVTNTNDWVFLIGRNEDSGSRIAPQAEAALGVPASKASFGLNMQQHYAVFTANTGSISTDGAFASDDTDMNGNPLGSIQTGGTNCTVSDVGLWPADAPVNTEPSINYQIEGHSGQIAGGDVAAVLEAVNPLFLNLQFIDSGDGVLGINWDTTNSTDHKQKAYLIGYLGGADAGGIPASAGCTALTYNGVPYTPENVLNGSYTFWTFEHMYYRTGAATNAVSGVSKAYADDVADQIFSRDAQTDSSGNVDTNSPGTSPKDGGVLFNKNAKFTRSAEGQPVTPLQF